jgi:superfamily II DNA or RNA helicase/HKD family nuclease
MNQPQQGIYERLVREDEYDDLRRLESENRVWLEIPSAAQRRHLLIDEFTAHIPELLDAVASGSDQDSETARRELKLMADLLRATRSSVPDSKLPSMTASDVLVLHAVHEPNLRPIFPRTGLRQPWLFTSAKGEPSLYSELRAELETAEQLDLIISFITWGGVRKLEDVFARATATDAGGNSRLKMRVLTTTYMGATDRSAVDALAKLPGVEVRVSLDGRRERLHAKAWLFGRSNGFGTAFVGSANLSKSALIDGIEWTLKISQSREAVLFESARANFESHWNDPEFQPYDPRNDEHRAALDRALLDQRGGHGTNVPLLRTWFDIQPKPFQQAILDRLDHERAHGRTKNLLVAATGTGKTVVSAFDYKHLCDRQGGQPRLLFVAHQRQILQQAMDTFRQVLRDPNFGELLDGQTQPASYDHLFAMIQTLSGRALVNQLGANYWQMVIIDEAHHLPANTFDAFVREIRPKFLLGLTATPERADGKSLNAYFDSRPDGSPAYSLRVWDALDQQLLCPFEYYATGDGVDLRGVEWGKAGELQQLGNIIGASHVRAEAVLQALQKYLQDDGLTEMKAIAFCVTVEHARFMSDFFNARGLSAEALTGDDSQTKRDDAIRRLSAGELRVLCTVNLFNEGVDLPSVNTLILLRPTQSPVVFQQQIGRGLRLHPGKPCCVVLDFIGQYSTDYRFDILYRSLTGMNRKQLNQSVESGFGHLPAGCHIQLDKISRDRVLQNLKQSLVISRLRLQRELAAWAAGRPGPFRLSDFLQGQMIELAELYDNHRSWNALKRDVGLSVPEFGPRDASLLVRAGSLIHVNDPRLLRAWQAWLDGKPAGTREILMLAHQLLHERDPVTVAQFRDLIEANLAMKAELQELLAYLEESSDFAETTVSGAPDNWSISLHSRYSRRQIQATTGHATETTRPSNREGILPLTQERVEILFVTLDKSSGFSEAVQYGDYAVSPERFHWKTQNRAKPSNASGRRYLDSSTNGWRFFLFVREDCNSAFACAGQVLLEHHEYDGKGPIGITWRLLQPLSADLFRRFSVLRDA